jgi:hypothetical protein
MFVPVAEPFVVERRSQDRKDVTYYMKLVNNDTQEVLGHMADISLGGFKLDSIGPVPVNKHFRFTMILPSEVADQPYLAFLARSKWCKVDPLDPNVYNVGFELTNITPSCFKYFKRMVEIFGSTNND